MEAQTEQVVKLATGTFGGALTVIFKSRVTNAVSIDESGKLIFSFIESDAQEATFYAGFLDRVIAYPENPAKAKAQYLKNQIAANPQAYTLPEIAFLCKILVLPSFTLPITMSFEGWENVARVNPANLPVVFEQLWNTTPTATTGAVTPTPTPTTQNGTDSSGANTNIWSVLGGISVYFITRFFSKKQ